MLQPAQLEARCEKRLKLAMAAPLCLQQQRLNDDCPPAAGTCAERLGMSLYSHEGRGPHAHVSGVCCVKAGPQANVSY